MAAADQQSAEKTDQNESSSGRSVPQLNFTMPRLDARSWLSTLREGIGTLLARPLTSFHLIVSLAVVLTALGLIMVLSASSVEGYAEGSSSYGMFATQVIFAIAGWLSFYGILKMPIRYFRRFATVGIVASLALLALVLVPSIGVKVNGARRWFDIAGISIQPSELAKVALCVWGAHLLASRKHVGAWGRELLFPLVPVAVFMCVLIILEPNQSTTMIIGIIVASLLWFGGLPGQVFAGFAGLFALAGALLALTADYRAARVFSFLDSSGDALDSGYQATQAKYALANGGVFGVGLGQSTAKWNYLPNAHNDFIFAIIGEELGLIGALSVVGLFLLLAYTGMRIARRSTDPFLRLLCATITVLITAQVFINIGYVVGLLPVTGIQLPLLSQGGTSMLTMLTMLGLLASAARHEPEAVAALSTGSQRGLSRLLRLPAPAAYQPRAVDRLHDRLDRRRSAGTRPAEPRRGPRPAPAAARVRRPVTGTPPVRGVRARDQRSDEIHYPAGQTRARNPQDLRRSTGRGGRSAGAPRRTEYRHR